MNEQNESRQPREAMSVETIEDIFAVSSIVAQRSGRNELRTFCLMVSAIESRGGLDALVKTLNSEIAQFLGDLLISREDSLQEWPEAIEFDEEQEF
jgi:hypothetical protein